jgi:acetoin utilization protein AcuB
VARLAFFHRLAREERGSATAEYAIMLGLILAVTFLGLDVLSRTTETAFQKVGDVLQPNALAVKGVEASPILDENARLQLQVARSNLSITLVLAGGITVCMFAAVFIVWRQSRKKMLEAAAKSKQVAAAQHEVKYAQPKLIAKRQQIFKMLARNIERLLHSTLQVKQLMTADVASVPPETSLERVSARMSELEIRHLMVVSHAGKLLGVISDRDLKSRSGKNAESIMTREVHTVSPDVEISPAVTMMLDRSISCLPVVQDGLLKGIVTSTDLMMAVQCSLHVLRNATEAIEEPAIESKNIFMPAAAEFDPVTTAPTQA